MTNTKLNPRDDKAIAKAAEAGRKAVADAEALVLTRQDAFDQADEAKEDTEAALMGGDESISALDLATVRAELDRSDYLLTAAKRRVASSQRAVVNDDKRVADAVAPLVSKAIGLDVTTFSVTPSRLDLESPELVVIQPASASLNQKTGTLAADLIVQFNRPALYARLNAEAIEAALKAAEFNADVLKHQMRSTQHGDITLDEVTVKVLSAWDGAPIISELTEKAAHEVAQDVHVVISKITPKPQVSADRFNDHRSSRVRVSSELKDHKILSSKIDGDGMLRSVVRAEVWTFTGVQAATEAALAKIDGQPAKGAGLIERMELVSHKVLEPANQREIYRPVLTTVDAHIVSRTV